MKVLHRLRFWLARRRNAGELAEEMRLHREMIEERFRREGMTPLEARRAAAVQFGNAATALEESRDQWSFVWLDSVVQDLRYAFRALRRSKAFTATAVLTLGVGLGLNTVLFTIFSAYVLRPFAVRDPYSLYELHWSAKNTGSRFFAWREYQELRHRQDIFSDALATSYAYVPQATHSLAGLLVSGNYFQMLGADALLGRGLVEEDAALPGATPVVVLSHQAWKIAFGQDTQIVGKKLLLNGHPFEVIGVTRPEFAGLDERPPDFWVPLTMFRELKPGQDLFAPDEPQHVAVVGRLRADVTPEQAAGALAEFMQRSAARQSDAPKSVKAQLYPRSTAIAYTPEMIKVFSPLLAAFILVLVAACANVANMMLARATARQREIGVRLSLGASRSRLIRQLLTESLLIALLAGLTGIAIAQLTIDLSRRLMFATMPPEFAKIVRLVPVVIDHRVFFFVLSAATAATLLFGLVPALQATRTRLLDALRGDFGVRFRASRLRDALVVNQVTVCLVLLVSAATLFRNTDTFQKRDVGLRVKDVVEVSSSDPQFRQLAPARLRAGPAIAEIAAVRRAPLFGRPWPTGVRPAGASEITRAGYNFVSPEYFRLFEIPILRGRNFTADEAAAEASVVVISEATARRFWPGQEALGKTIRMETVKERFVDPLPGYSQVQVVGIAKDVISGFVLDGPDRTCIYFPTSLNGKHAGAFLVRGKSGQSSTSLQASLIAQWPNASLELIPMEQALALQIYPFRAASWIGSLLGAVALLLTISGMYGVMAYLVAQRTKEIGIRMALGASPAVVLQFIMRHSLKLTAVGVALGLALSWAALKLVTAFSTWIVWDASPFAGALVLVIAAALLAAFFPSRRASRVDPVSTLRAE